MQQASSAGLLQMQQAAHCTPESCVYIAENPIKDFIAQTVLGGARSGSGARAAFTAL
jgi:hypothetical protein